MKLVYDFSRLKEIANKFYVEDSGFQLNYVQVAYQPLDIALHEGLEVDLNDVEVVQGLLSYDGRQTLLYIKDHSYNFDSALRNPQQGNKFHVADCKTLQGMRQKNRFQRYVATNNLSGLFKIASSKHEGYEPEIALWVCQYCLSMLNYHGSRESATIRRETAQNFKLSEFFTDYSTCFVHLPMGIESSKVGYSDDWASISRTIREERHYQCQQCRVQLYSAKHLCHVHHKNGVKSDNRKSNLEVLCADCHRKEHIDSMGIKKQDMAKIMQLRKAQGLLENLTWDDVLMISDSALYGELKLFRYEGYEAPCLLFSLPNGIELDVAWPMRKEALVGHDIYVSGWSCRRYGEHLSDN